MSRLRAGIQGFLYPRTINQPTPKSKEGIKQYDSLEPLEAIWRAWNEPGPNPTWHFQKKHQVKAALPLLARALDRIEREQKGEEMEVVYRPTRPRFLVRENGRIEQGFHTLQEAMAEANALQALYPSNSYDVVDQGEQTNNEEKREEK